MSRMFLPLRLNYELDKRLCFELWYAPITRLYNNSQTSFDTSFPRTQHLGHRMLCTCQ